MVSMESSKEFLGIIVGFNDKFYAVDNRYKVEKFFDVENFRCFTSLFLLISSKFHMRPPK